MPPKNKKTKEDRLLQQKLAKRRQYATIKNDPELLAIAREKRRARYLKDKEAKKVRSITEITPRSQREQRKRWRENSRRYRQNKKEKKDMPVIFEVIHVDAGPSQDKNISNISNHGLEEDPLRSTQIASLVKSEVRKFRYAELKKRKKLLRIIATYKKRDSARRQQIHRLKKLLHEREKTKMDEEDYQSILKDHSYSSRVESNNHTSTHKHKNTTSLRELVKSFYLDGINSVICPGKKQYIKKNNIRKQKRYLSLPLKHLYRKFLSEVDIKISYSFFCKLRPFWVVFPRKSDRDTCLCQVHLNMDLLVKGLNKASVIVEKNYEEVLSKMCCNKRSTDCLKRICIECKSNEIECNVFPDSECTFYEWRKIRKEVSDTNGNKKYKAITEKIKIKMTSTGASIKFKQDLINFFDHNYKIVSQYTAIKNLKENLHFQEACVHVDFSENYSLKYGAEVQSFHFGGSRQQISLHTAVVHTYNFSKAQVCATSMCTISDCLRHDAPAVWSHLIPLIEQVIKLNPFVDTIHFISDSPSSQYRNKYIFYIITQLHKDFPQLNSITWNYSEVGHGKGAPDGVGATLKRTADRMVLYGKDVGSFNQFYELITACIENEEMNVIVKKVEQEDILLKTSLIPGYLQPFQGTFSVYQALWDKSKSQTILRKSSCFVCGPSKICEHGNHLECIPVIQKENVRSNAKKIDVTPLVYLKSTKNKNIKVTVLSDITLNETNIPLIKSKPSISKQT